ncbi:uncharacterized protein MYCFIDRAFT_211934 [Pseudocercospora fijiensis CIRAD86]|uniref:Uncharacterized protein n=1 Tax=Pseudocercospora fijiensis (strain CIRAD86) TaxID=383855 RepID=M2ZLP8_PSEFD|nr:uncharacterized protein MYCFIDRAFT_211934 [Pseudocercospora fijiensis CIRAD86]EME79999.1 hypothetical protein MYCFIDRAFT_211934 [Pseudocercospora fijiensis CIRAD86]
MTNLVQVGPQAHFVGRLEWPYDATRMNTHRLDGETRDIEQFHVDLNTTGESWEKVSVDIFVHRNGTKVHLTSTSQPQDFWFAQSIDFRGDLPRTLTITRLSHSCDSVGFYYGDPFDDGYSWFWFTSDDEGIGEWAYTNGGKNSRARYCQQ